MFKEIIMKIKNKIIRMLGGYVYLEEARIIKNVRKTEYDITPLRAEIACLKDKHVNLELTSEDISRIKENLKNRNDGGRGTMTIEQEVLLFVTWALVIALAAYCFSLRNKINDKGKDIQEAEKDLLRNRHSINEIQLDLNRMERAIKDLQGGAECEEKLKPCPFCGRKMVFCKETHINKHGKQYTEQYYMHEEYDINKEENCILDEICMPFVIGAGDATENYIGEYAEKWNRRADNGNRS